MPEEVTPPNGAKAAALLLKAINNKLWRDMVMTQHDGINALWRNPHATPQEVCNELGTRAVLYFDDHAALTELIVARATASGITPDILLPTNAFTRNVDSSVTVSDQPYAP